MKRIVKIPLIVLGSLIGLVLIAGLIGWFYVNATFLDFEKDYPERKEFAQLSEQGYEFTDRNDNGELDPYEDDRLPVATRVQDLLEKMTMEEKLHLLKGSGMASALGRLEPGEGIPGAVGTIVPTPRLGLPTIYLSDGPAGLRIMPTREGEERTYYATAFPIGTQLASTWNKELCYDIGKAMGTEAREYGIDIILGPGANIHRHPFTGRNFEYFSEDPVLTGEIGAAVVNGIESEGVGTSVKHFVANNQETNRNFNDAIVSERALREIYLRGFEIIVDRAQPWTIMSSYNKTNGTYVAEDRRLLTDVLRDEWNFEGVVMSDWFGGQDAPAMIRAGNDLLEPGTKRQWKALQEAQMDGTLSAAEIDTSVARILRLILKSRKMQNYRYGNDPNLKAHAAIARQAAAEGVVLLKDEGVLPLRHVRTIALLGVTSYDLIAGGTGSGDVNEAYSVSLEEGLRNAGYELSASARTVYDDHVTANEEAFVKPEGMAAMWNPYDPPEIDYTDEQIQRLAAEADLAILTIGRNSGEGGDRTEVDDFLLTEQELKLLDRANNIFHAAGKSVVVVLNVGGVIETASWSDRADAILLAWQGGQEGGNAVADVLNGTVSPSGRLPMTFPQQLSDHASHANFPLDGRPIDLRPLIFPKEKKEEDLEKDVDITRYEEGIYVGYRHFDRANLEVAYPFGHGLSYTQFDYREAELAVSGDTVYASVLIENTGDREGKEVVQAYVAKKQATIERPRQELKAFEKTPRLDPEATHRIRFAIPFDDLRYWDEITNCWQLEPGTYTLRIGSSSRDVRVSLDFGVGEKE